MTLHSLDDDTRLVRDGDGACVHMIDQWDELTTLCGLPPARSDG
jgi:hypothetical protein